MARKERWIAFIIAILMVFQIVLTTVAAESEGGDLSSSVSESTSVSVPESSSNSAQESTSVSESTSASQSTSVSESGSASESSSSGSSESSSASVPESSSSTAPESSSASASESMSQPIAVPPMGEELLKVLRGLSGDELKAKLMSLTEEQGASLKDVASEEDIKQWELVLGIDAEEEKEEAVQYSPATSPLDVGPIIASIAAPLQMRAFSALRTPRINPHVTPITGLLLDKKAFRKNTDDNAPTYQIDLNVSSQSVIIDKVKPCDIVLVLDESISMDGAFYYKLSGTPDRNQNYYIKESNEYIKVKYSDWYDEWGYFYWGWHQREPEDYQFYIKSTKMEALIDAANKFVDSVALKSPASKIAVVSFADNVAIDIGLTSVSTNINGIKSVISNLAASEYATRADRGMQKAVEIFQADNQQNRNRVVVMFTDGEPSVPGSNFDNWVAASTINHSAILKGTRGQTIVSGEQFQETLGDPQEVTGLGCGATVYTVGVFSANSDPKVTEYMTRVATPADGSKRYFLTADSPESLNDIFQRISEETGNILQSIIVKDYIDPRFEVVQSSLTGDVSTGSDANGAYVQWSVNKIEPGPANAFNASFTVKPKASFFGGNNIPTNVDGISAVYIVSNGTPNNIGSFPYPKVNVPIKLGVTPLPCSIFLGENATYTLDQAKAQMFAEPVGTNNTFEYTWVPNTFDASPKNTTTYRLTVKCTPEPAASKQTNDPVDIDSPKTASADYTVTVVKGSLDITKNISTEADPNQSFVFKIERRDTENGAVLQTFYQVVRTGAAKTGNVTVNNLPKGFYTVTEQTGWSWRYNSSVAGTPDKTLGIGAGDARLTDTSAHAAFNNAKARTNWLSSIGWVVNSFVKGAIN